MISTWFYSPVGFTCLPEMTYTEDVSEKPKYHKGDAMNAQTITAAIDTKMSRSGNELTDNLIDALTEALGDVFEAASDLDDPSIVTEYLQALGHATLETANNL